MGRAPCCLKVGLHRGPWTTTEDAMLVQYIQIHGEGNWRNMPKEAGLLRCGKSCRLRWMNYLRPDIKRGNITPDEDELIIRLHSLLGNRWSLIAGRLPGRTDNEIKNYWNSHLAKKLKPTTTTSTSPITTTNKQVSKQTKGPRKKLPNNMNNTTSTTNKSEKQLKEDMIKDSPNIHVPKPVRASSFVFLRNQSFDSLVSGSPPSFGEGDKGGGIDTPSQVFDLPAWSSNFTEGGDHSGSTSLIDCGDENHELAAYISCQTPNIMLDQLYEEYQQLLKVEDDAHVDAFLESLLD